MRATLPAAGATLIAVLMTGCQSGPPPRVT